MVVDCHRKVHLSLAPERRHHVPFDLQGGLVKGRLFCIVLSIMVSEDIGERDAFVGGEAQDLLESLYSRGVEHHVSGVHHKVRFLFLKHFRKELQHPGTSAVPDDVVGVRKLDDLERPVGAEFKLGTIYFGKAGDLFRSAGILSHKWTSWEDCRPCQHP